MEKTPYQELVHLNGTRGSQKEDKMWSGRPVTMKTDDNVEKVRTLVRTDRRLCIIMIAEELNMGKEMVRQLLRTNLNMK